MPMIMRQSQDIAKYDENMKNESNDIGKKDMVLYKRDNGIQTKYKRPIETSDIDNDFMREYDEMHKLMEYKQTYDYVMILHYNTTLTPSSKAIYSGTKYYDTHIEFHSLFLDVSSTDV